MVTVSLLAAFDIRGIVPLNNFPILFTDIVSPVISPVSRFVAIFSSILSLLDLKRLSILAIGLLRSSILVVVPPLDDTLFSLSLSPLNRLLFLLIEDHRLVFD